MTKTTELGFTHAELFEMALSLEIVDDGDEIELEDLQELLSAFAGDEI
jgi:hypothetical protein